MGTYGAGEVSGGYLSSSMSRPSGLSGLGCGSISAIMRLYDRLVLVADVMYFFLNDNIFICAYISSDKCIH